jgi:hypothetical protein
MCTLVYTRVQYKTLREKKTSSRIHIKVFLRPGVMFKLEQAQDSCTLSSEDVMLCNELKMKCLCTGIVVQDHRTAALAAHVTANVSFLSSSLPSESEEYDRTADASWVAIADEELKAHAVFSHFDEILGSVEVRSQGIDMDRIGLSRGQVPTMDHFSEDEVWNIIQEMPPAMNQLVLPNQSTFIRGRAIHDNFWTVQSSAKLLHIHGISSILLKVDIAKAFDIVNCLFLHDLLNHILFSRRWLNWISSLLSTTSTRIILNGRPGQRICHARELRQGDPLSPLHFILVMEAPNGLFRRVDLNDLLSPLCAPSIKFRLSLYADDLVIFLLLEEKDIWPGQFWSSLRVLPICTRICPSASSRR